MINGSASTIKAATTLVWHLETKIISLQLLGLSFDKVINVFAADTGLLSEAAGRVKHDWVTADSELPQNRIEWRSGMQQSCKTF